MNIVLNSDKAPSHLTDEVGMCYYDPKTEDLKEFDPSVVIHTGPFERSVRRFYLVKPSGTIRGQLYTQAKIKVESQSPHVEHKVKVGLDNISIPSDFIEYDLNNEIIVLFSHHTTGVIPIDLYTRCNIANSLEATLALSLEVS